MRDDFTQQTLDTLAKRVGVRCSNPGCRKLTSGPRTETSRVINIGVAAHITAASSGGPRFAPDLSSEERRSPDNGIWLCQNCAKLVDNDRVRYTVEVLCNWKQRAETVALQEIEGFACAQGSIQENSVDLEISFRKIKMHSERHDYLLEVTAKNSGTEPVCNYHLDLELPARVIENPQSNPLYVTDRSSRTICFFRVGNRSNSEPIFPEDTKLILSLPYYMDESIYCNRGSLFDELVRVVFYRQGFRPLVVEQPFGELQFY